MLSRSSPSASTSTVLLQAGPAPALENKTNFARFAWGVLGWNVLVVLWGAYVRASGSGAGCGSHWPLCNGVVLPRAPQLATIIEFTHRMTSGVALLGVVALCWWAFRSFSAGHVVCRTALWSLGFLLAEALLGAGLVLFNFVDKNASVGRAIYLSAHLVNTQLLLAMLTLTAWFAGHLQSQRRSGLITATLPIALLVTVTGAIAALGDTLFPATSLAAGFQQDFSSAAHFLLRLRVIHPILAGCAAAYFLAAAFSANPAKASWVVASLVVLQLCAGAINLLLLAPVWLQLVHLLLADALWIALVILAYSLPKRSPA